MYKIVFFVPREHAEGVKEAMFAAGAGRFENYDRCSWECEGTGQFRPSDQASPFIGRRQVLERLSELRVEMICEDKCVRPAVEALIEAHPYEEPAYEAYRVFALADLPAVDAGEEPPNYGAENSQQWADGGAAENNGGK